MSGMIRETVLTCPEDGCGWDTRWSLETKWTDDFERDGRLEYREHWIEKHSTPPTVPDPVETTETWT